MLDLLMNDVYIVPLTDTKQKCLEVYPQQADRRRLTVQYSNRLLSIGLWMGATYLSKR